MSVETLLEKFKDNTISPDELLELKKISEAPVMPCEFCGKPTIKSCNFKRFCSKNCHKRFHKLKVRNKPCDICGLKYPVKMMTVHHKDGNHRNNNKENLQGLCPNCHYELEYCGEVTWFKMLEVKVAV